MEDIDENANCGHFTMVGLTLKREFWGDENLFHPGFLERYEKNRCPNAKHASCLPT